MAPVDGLLAGKAENIMSASIACGVKLVHFSRYLFPPPVAFKVLHAYYLPEADLING